VRKEGPCWRGGKIKEGGRKKKEGKDTAIKVREGKT